MDFKQDIEELAYRNGMMAVDFVNEGVASLPDHLRENVSDGYHTFKELYAHRVRLFVTLCNVLERTNLDMSAHADVHREMVPWKSRKHFNGSEWEGWFIAGIGTDPGRTITYHLPNEAWDDIPDVPELEIAPEWDGHTSDDILGRLLKIR